MLIIYEKIKKRIGQIANLCFAIFTLYVTVLFYEEPNIGLVIAYGIITLLFLLKKKLFWIDLLTPSLVVSILYIPIGMLILGAMTGESPNPIVYMNIPFTVLPVVFLCAYVYNLIVFKFLRISLGTSLVRQLIIGVAISTLSFFVGYWFEYLNDLNYNADLGYLNYIRIQPNIMNNYLALFLLQHIAFIAVNYLYNKFKNRRDKQLSLHKVNNR